jgi:hypothetical protein
MKSSEIERGAQHTQHIPFAKSLAPQKLKHIAQPSCCNICRVAGKNTVISMTEKGNASQPRYLLSNDLDSTERGSDCLLTHRF